MQKVILQKPYRSPDDQHDVILLPINNEVNGKVPNVNLSNM